jgi:hypothetical protein
MARIFMTPGEKMFATLIVYSCHAYNFFVYVAKYSHLHGWNIPIKEIIFLLLWLGFRVKMKQLDHPIQCSQYLTNTFSMMCDFSHNET